MLVKIVVFVLLITAITSSIFLWFVYIKQYRFATLLVDLLPLYPILVLLGFAINISGVIFLCSNEMNLILLITLLLLVNYGIQFVFFWQWFSSYRLKNYLKLLQKLKSNPKFRVISVEEWLDNPQKDPNHILVLIRHDVDISLVRAKKMLIEEKKLEIPSCFYFRNNAERYSFTDAKQLIDIITESESITVGFHYETITNTNGNLTNAMELFSKEVEKFRLIYPIRMVAAHGDKYRNSRLVSEKLVDLKSLNLESSYQLPYDNYLSDAGGFHHFISHNNKKVTFIEKLTALDETAFGSLVQILVHPDWWF